MEKVTINGKEYQLDIEQAKRLNLLKEKDNRVKSWKEFEEKYKNSKGYACANILTHVFEINFPINTDEQLTQHEAKAITAFAKLLKLRRDWIGEWEPDWTNENICKFVIIYVDKYIQMKVRSISARSLSFPTEQMAEEFLLTFRDLLEEAKDLI